MSLRAGAMSDVDESGARRKTPGRLAPAKGVLSLTCVSIRALKTNVVCVTWVGLGTGLKTTTCHLRPPSSIILRYDNYLEHDK